MREVRQPGRWPWFDNPYRRCITDRGGRADTIGFTRLPDITPVRLSAKHCSNSLPVQCMQRERERETCRQMRLHVLKRSTAGSMRETRSAAAVPEPAASGAYLHLCPLFTLRARCAPICSCAYVPASCAHVNSTDEHQRLPTTAALLGTHYAAFTRRVGKKQTSRPNKGQAA